MPDTLHYFYSCLGNDKIKFFVRQNLRLSYAPEVDGDVRFVNCCSFDIEVMYCDIADLGL